MANVILKNGTGTPVEYKGIETIEVPKADAIIVSEMEFSGFAYDDYFGLYILDVPSSPITLDAGEKYKVIWDGATFICECQDLSAMSDGALGVGNLADFGGTGNGEPFVVGTVDGILMLASFTEGERHTVTIAKIGGTQIFSEGVATSVAMELNFTDVVEKEIYPERTLEDFAFNEMWGAYTSLSEPIFDLVLGEKYKVYWDGEWYECETQDAGAVMEGALMLGNGSNFGLSGNNEPFAIGWLSIGITFLSVGSEATSHTVAVNQFVAGMKITPASDGELISKVTIPKPDTLIPENILEGVNVAGIVGTMVAGLPALEDVPITLDFTNGNQTITAPEGYLVKSAILQKPADLLAANIAKGKDIGGIIGTLVAGSGEPSTILKKTFASVPNGTTLFTAEELVTIGFSIASDSFLLAFPAGGRIFANSQTQKTVLAFVLGNNDLLFNGKSYGGINYAGFVVCTSYKYSGGYILQTPTLDLIPSENKLSVVNNNLPYFDSTDGSIKFAGGGDYSFTSSNGSARWTFIVGKST